MVIITRLTFTYLHRFFTSKKEKKKKTCKSLRPSVRPSVEFYFYDVIWLIQTIFVLFHWCTLAYSKIIHGPLKKEKKVNNCIIIIFSRIVGYGNIFIKFRPQLDTEWVSSQSHWFNKIVICQITSLIKISIKLNTFIFF